jgi:hypothetical protein
MREPEGGWDEQILGMIYKAALPAPPTAATTTAPPPLSVTSTTDKPATASKPISSSGMLLGALALAAAVMVLI